MNIYIIIFYLKIYYPFNIMLYDILTLFLMNMGIDRHSLQQLALVSKDARSICINTFNALRIGRERLYLFPFSMVCVRSNVLVVGRKKLDFIKHLKQLAQQGRKEAIQHSRKPKLFMAVDCVCGFQITTSRDLYNHKKNKKLNNECKTFIKNYEKQKPVRAPAVYSCRICGEHPPSKCRTNKQKSAYVTMCWEKHFEPWKCPYCTWTNSFMGNIVQHLENNHRNY
jgi:hypothetical protein